MKYLRITLIPLGIAALAFGFWQFGVLIAGSLPASGNIPGKGNGNLQPVSPAEKFLAVDKGLQDHPVLPVESKELCALGSKVQSSRNNAIQALLNSDPEKIAQGIVPSVQVNDFARYSALYGDLSRGVPCLIPCHGRDASDFGGRFHPILHRFRMHTGRDIAAPAGTPIRAANDATVFFAGTKNGYGNAVVLDHGKGYHTLYGHCSRLLVKTGQKVSRGDVIALVGSTGLATGPHLHYEVHVDGSQVDPTAFMRVELSGAPACFAAAVGLRGNGPSVSRMDVPIVPF